MQDDVTREGKDGVEKTESVKQVTAAEPRAEELGDEALENVAGGASCYPLSTRPEPDWPLVQ